MKKIALLLLISIMSIDIATAQNNPSKHEISLSYGVLPANELLDVLSIIVTAPLIAITGTYDSKSYSGAVTFSYYNKVSKVTRVGISYSVDFFDADIIVNHSNVGRGKGSYHTIMPSAKFNWLNRDVISLYSKISAGIQIMTAQNSFKQGQPYQASSSTDYDFTMQFSPLGIEVGKTFAVFGEAGIGNSGLLLAGVRVRF